MYLNLKAHAPAAHAAHATHAAHAAHAPHAAHAAHATHAAAKRSVFFLVTVLICVRNQTPMKIIARMMRTGNTLQKKKKTTINPHGPCTILGCRSRTCTRRLLCRFDLSNIENAKRVRMSPSTG